MSKIIFHNGLESNGSCAFKICAKLVDIGELPKSLEFIGDEAFWGCNSIKKVEIPFGIKKIGNYLFSEDTKQIIIL